MIMMGDKKKQLMSQILGPEKEDKEKESEGYDALHAICEELISAIHAKDVAATCEAFKAAFDELEREPHEEGPHTNED